MPSSPPFAPLPKAGQSPVVRSRRGERRLVATIWVTVDRLGRPVTLSDAAWEHIVDGHGELTPQPADIQEAIALADEVRRDRNFVRRAIHYRHTGPGRLRLRVVVNYRPSAPFGWAGEVITAHFTGRQYQNEVPLWP